jgi:hypothetical protein
MLGVFAPDGKMVDSGLTPLLDEFGVKLGDNRVLVFQYTGDLTDQPPIVAKTRVSPDVEHKLAASLDRATLRTLAGVRTVDPKPGAPGPFRVDPILVVPPQTRVCFLAWAEENLATKLGDLMHEYFTEDNRPERADPEKIDKLTSNPKFTTQLSVAVTVAETGGRPTNPHQLSAEGKPRMVVIGTSDIANDENISREGGDSFAVVGSSLGYLREKPEMIGIPAKTHERYKPSDKAGDSYWSMVMQPFVFMFFGILGLGLAVWFVRQR